MEVLNNYAPITLALACGIADPTITVTNPSALSLTGNYRLLIDDEFMLATSRTGSVVSVLRGQEGSTAAAHSLSVPVEPIVTAGALNQLRADAGGLQGYVSVVTGTPATLSPTEQIAGCQSSAGTTVVNMPTTPATSIVAGTRALIFDDQNNAAVNNVTVHGNGSNIEDPNTAGTFTSSTAITVSSMAVMWVYDGVNWKVASAVGAAGGGIAQLTGDTTAGPGAGSQVATTVSAQGGAVDGAGASCTVAGEWYGFGSTVHGTAYAIGPSGYSTAWSGLSLGLANVSIPGGGVGGNPVVSSNGTDTRIGTTPGGLIHFAAGAGNDVAHFKAGIYPNWNFQLGPTADWGGGVNVFGLDKVSTTPTSSPSSGRVIIWADIDSALAGASSLFFRNDAGTVVDIGLLATGGAPANIHNISTSGTIAAQPGGEYFVDLAAAGGDVIITTAGTIGAKQKFFVKIIDPSGGGAGGHTVTIQPIVAGQHIESVGAPGTLDATSVSYILSVVGQEVELTSNDGTNLWY